MRMTKEKRDQLLLVGLVAAVLAGGLWYVWISPTSRKIDRARVQVQKARQDFEKADGIVKQMDPLQAELDETQKALGGIESGMVSLVDPLTWAYGVRDSLRSRNSEVEVSSVTRPTEGPPEMLGNFPYNEGTFTMTGKAKYEDLGKFLADFENLYPYFRVRNLQLSTSGRDAGGGDAGGGTSSLVGFNVNMVALVRPSQ